MLALFILVPAVIFCIIFHLCWAEFFGGSTDKAAMLFSLMAAGYGTAMGSMAYIVCHFIFKYW